MIKRDSIQKGNMAFNPLHLEKTTWGELKKELARDVYIFVDSQLNILDAAQNIAEDQKNLVESWLNKGWLRRLSLDDIERWEETPEKPFHAFIIHPFILVQEDVQ